MKRPDSSRPGTLGGPPLGVPRFRSRSLAAWPGRDRLHLLRMTPHPVREDGYAAQVPEADCDHPPADAISVTGLRLGSSGPSDRVMAARRPGGWGASRSPRRPGAGSSGWRSSASRGAAANAAREPGAAQCRSPAGLGSRKPLPRRSHHWPVAEGTVIIIGGAEDKVRDRVILSRFVALAGGPDARSRSSAPPLRSGSRPASATARSSASSASRVRPLHAVTRPQANDETACWPSATRPASS